MVRCAFIGPLSGVKRIFPLTTAKISDSCWNFFLSSRWYCCWRGRSAPFRASELAPPCGLFREIFMPVAVVAVEDFKPASSNQSGKQYPQVNSERRARFRIVAPQAQNVKVPEWGGVALTKGEDGA